MSQTAFRPSVLLVAAPKPGFDPANDREIASISELINKLHGFAVLAESGRFRLDE
jgi:hypothetical protein